MRSSRSPVSLFLRPIGTQITAPCSPLRTARPCLSHCLNPPTIVAAGSWYASKQRLCVLRVFPVVRLVANTRAANCSRSVSDNLLTRFAISRSRARLSSRDSPLLVGVTVWSVWSVVVILRASRGQLSRACLTTIRALVVSLALRFPGLREKATSRPQYLFCSRGNSAIRPP